MGSGEQVRAANDLGDPLRGVVDHMLKVPDAASLAAMNVLSRLLGRRVGASTGTNFLGLCWIASRMRSAGQTGSLVTLICDSGERYRDSYYSPAWLAAAGLEPAPHEHAIDRFLAGGDFDWHASECARSTAAGS